MADKPRCLIVTVGASLIEKYNNEKSRDIFTAKDIDALQSKNKWENSEWSRWRELCMYKDAEKKLSTWLKEQKTLEAFGKCSAELNSLYHIQPLPGERKRDKIVLIATRTPVGKLCSEILKEALTDIEINSDKVKISVDEPVYPEGLGKADDSTFITDGLPNFISDLSRQIQNHSEDYEVILVPTGGYKSLIPYATLAGILHGKEIKYIYEESDELMSLPSIPIGLDIEKWQPAYIKLDILTNQPAKNTKAYYENLDQSFKNLLVPPSDGNQSYKFNEMGKFLKQRYLQLRYQNPMQFQTAGTSLLRYLKRDEGKPDLLEFFSQLVKIGPYLWLGDKVPEMAEHALHHHTNLFEIAEIFLLPIQHHQEDFLLPEELFVLLCTIYFHDWGHVDSYLNGKSLLPIQIRDFHHILGYERLKNLGWRKELIKLGLHWVGDTTSSDEKANELWEKYLKLIAIIGLFHRKRMPLKETNATYYCPVNKKTYVALEKRANDRKEEEEDKEKGWFLQFEDKQFCNKRAMLIASLFRIIDSLDNQVARMGTDEEIRMKATVVQSDAQNEEKRKEKIEEMIKQYFNKNNNLITKIDNLIVRITGAYQQRETTGNTNTNKIKNKELDFEKEVNSLINSKFDSSKYEFAKSLIHLYIDACCWAFFKKEQPKHYLKHLSLKNPRISYEFKNKEHIIKIEFSRQKQEKLEKYREVFGFELDLDLPNIRKIIADIKDEYCRCSTVKSILMEKHLEIFYYDKTK